MNRDLSYLGNRSSLLHPQTLVADRNLNRLSPEIKASKGSKVVFPSLAPSARRSEKSGLPSWLLI